MYSGNIFIMASFLINKDVGKVPNMSSIDFEEVSSIVHGIEDDFERRKIFNIPIFSDLLNI